MQKHQKHPECREPRAESSLPEFVKDREGRRFAVSQHKGKARGKVRYIETSDASKGCRFL